MYQICYNHGGAFKVGIHLLLPLECIGKIVCITSGSQLLHIWAVFGIRPDMRMIQVPFWAQCKPATAVHAHVSLMHRQFTSRQGVICAKDSSLQYHQLKSQLCHKSNTNKCCLHVIVQQTFHAVSHDAFGSLPRGKWWGLASAALASRCRMQQRINRRRSTVSFSFSSRKKVPCMSNNATLRQQQLLGWLVLGILRALCMLYINNCTCLFSNIAPPPPGPLLPWYGHGQSRNATPVCLQDGKKN